jgi:hypothetical protein
MDGNWPGRPLNRGLISYAPRGNGQYIKMGSVHIKPGLNGSLLVTISRRILHRITCIQDEKKKKAEKETNEKMVGNSPSPIQTGGSFIVHRGCEARGCISQIHTNLQHIKMGSVHIISGFKWVCASNNFKMISAWARIHTR